MNPLIGFALPHAEQAPLDHLEGVRGYPETLLGKEVDLLDS
jgi:hypothetical protein